MKYTQIISALILSLFAFSASANIIADDDYNRTIILIDGDPYLVDLDDEGDLVDAIVPVPEYFVSEASHAVLVDRRSEDYASELANIKSRLLIFSEDSALIDQVAVDHVRDLARLYSKGYINEINIGAAHADTDQDEALAAHRISAVYHLLRDFGVQEEDITADMKNYQSDLPNLYVTMDIR